MLARYRMNSSCTLANFQSDLNNIILGNANTANSLSSGCNKSNTLLLGSYPTGYYSRVDSPTSIAITGATCVSNVATLTFSNQGSAPFPVGSIITVSGITGVTSYNGSFVVTGGSATSVTYALPTVSAGTTTNATVINSTTFTYSKNHNEYANTTNYFRLTFNAGGIQTITHARSYIANTNTLVNSQTLVDEFIPDDGIFTGSATVIGRRSFLASPRTTGDRIDVLRSTPLQYIDAAFIRNPLPGSRLVTTTQLSRFQVVDSQELVAYRETDQLGIRFSTFNSDINRAGIDLVITDKCFFISSPQSESSRFRSAHTGVDVGIFDICKNGITREFTDSMLMCNITLGAKLARVPYSYKLDTRSYGSLIDCPIIGNLPDKMYRNDGTTVVIENPTFMQQVSNGNALASIYGLYMIPNFIFADNFTYQDSNGLRRLVKHNYSILTE